MKPKLFIATLVMLSAASCIAPSKKIVGTYHDKHYKDTLIINQDLSYEYRETLLNDTIGWTNGNWKLIGRKVKFICDHEPLVGFALETKIDTTIRNFQLKLLLANKEEPIRIKSVEIYKNKVKLNNENDLILSVAHNIVKVYNTEFDSLVLKTFNFAPIKIKNNLNKDYGYNLKIYPAERLYDLDKLPFKLKSNRLVSKPVENNENGALNFVKLGS